MNDIEAKERIKELRATLEYHAKKSMMKINQK